MSDLHDLCKLSRPITTKDLDDLKFYLKSGIPSTYTIEEAYNFNNDIQEEPKTNTTPLHIICQHIPSDYNLEELEIISQMLTILFEYGAGWSFTDINNDTPGCILLRRNLKNKIFDQIVDAGVRAELLLRKVNNNIEFIEEDEDVLREEDEENEPEEVVSEKEAVAEDSKLSDEPQQQDPAEFQNSYLNNKLSYKDDALITSNNDGVMMSWESEIMQKACNTLFSIADDEMVVMNIGFGMGIIDGMIQDRKPAKHYIIEAHPDVLKKMKDDGWYEKPNVIILEGRWQEHLPILLDQGIFFNGIYYDTFSEHYSDMLDLFDYVVGLLKTNGTFSFFNGLGADRETIYQVYKKLIGIDLSDYGLTVEFEEYNVPDVDWNGIKRSYWNCPIYYHPTIRFHQ